MFAIDSSVNDTPSEVGQEVVDALIQTIKDGNCILLLGPDFSINSEDQSLNQMLAQQLASEINLPKSIEDKQDLVNVAQHYESQKPFFKLAYTVGNFYNKESNKINTIHEQIASLPFNLIITTNHDLMLPKAYANLQKPFKVSWYKFDGVNETDFEIGTGKTPLIYYLYGHIDDSNSLVLTENNLIEFLININSKNPLPTAISAQFKKRRTSFLFLGFNFNRWYLRVLLQVWKKNSTGSDTRDRSLAMEIIKPDESTIFFYNHGHKIDFYYGIDMKSFVKKLKVGFDNQIKPSTKLDTLQVSKPIKNAPFVFICHLSVDKDEANKLHNILRNNQINPWLDKGAVDTARIETGDEFDTIIRNAIKYKVDYFVVLLSKKWENLREGYVFLEVKAAKERQRGFREGEKFILPIKLDYCSIPNELSEIHYDENTDNNYSTIIRTIKNDWSRRNPLV